MKRILKLSLVFFSIIFLQGSVFFRNITPEEENDMFVLSVSDVITNPLYWVSERITYTLVEVNADGIIFWWNAPNVQSTLFNFVEQFYPYGFIGTGHIPYETALRRGYSNLMTGNLTAQQRFGFSIPLPVYVGEYPRINMDLHRFIVSQGRVRTAFMAGLSWGLSLVPFLNIELNILLPPQDIVLETLHFLTPSDYTRRTEQLQDWIAAYWNLAMSAIEPGQILIDSEMLVPGEYYCWSGYYWIKYNIMMSSFLDFQVPLSVGTIVGYNTPMDILSKLEANTGSYFSIVLRHIIWHGVNAGAGSVDWRPERIMPFQRDTLHPVDSYILGIDDPRVKTTELGLSLQTDLFSLIRTPLNSNIINFAGNISRWSLNINRAISSNFEISMMFWRHGFFVTVALMIFSFWLAILTFRTVVNIARGAEGKLVHVFIAIFVTSLMFAIILVPNQVFRTVQGFSVIVFNSGALVLTQMNLVQNFIQGDEPDTIRRLQYTSDLVFWLPYFSLWTAFNTSGGLLESRNMIDYSNIANEPEQQYRGTLVQAPFIRNAEYNTMWSMILAETFSQGPINPNAYRVVDHFLAPRVELTIGSFTPTAGPITAPPIVSVSRNENYRGALQRSVDIGIFSIIVLIFLFVLVKLLFFLEFLFELMMFPFMVSASVASQRDVRNIVLRLGTSLIRVGIVDIIIAFLVFLSLRELGLIGLIISFFIGFVFVKTIRSIPKMSIWRPRIV